MLRLSFSSGAVLTAPDSTENPGGCHVLAVEDRFGTVVVHSTFEQWQTAPEQEMTRVIDALAGTRAANDIDLETGAAVHVLRTAGRLLVVAPHGTPVDALAVETLDRRPVAYWVSDEWKDDPELVIGALIGALRIS